MHGLNALADNDDVERITRRINGGLNGLAKRQAFLTLAKGALKHADERTAVEVHVSGAPARTTSGAVPGLSAAAVSQRPAPQGAVEETHKPALAIAGENGKAANRSEPEACARGQYRSAA